MIQMQRTIKESMNISLQEKEALIAILKMKTNMSLTNSQEKKEMEQFIKSLNNTDHIKLNMLLRENFLKQQRSPRSILESNESDQILNECELLFSCKLCCHSMNDYNTENTESDFRGKMKNCTNGDGTIVVVSLINFIIF